MSTWDKLELFSHNNGHSEGWRKNAQKLRHGKYDVTQFSAYYATIKMRWKWAETRSYWWKKSAASYHDYKYWAFYSGDAGFNKPCPLCRN